MSKKETKEQNEEQFSAEQLEFARIQMRKQFNENLSKWATIREENATEEDIKVAEKDLTDYANSIKTSSFILAEPEKALETYNVLREWNKNVATWEGAGWKGVIMFDNVLNKLEAEIKDESNTQNFEVDYSSLMYLYQGMIARAPHGTGVETARFMAALEKWDTENYVDADVDEVTYTSVANKVIEHIKYLQSVDKKVSILKNRLDLAYAGLAMDLKVESLEEYIEFYEAISKQAVPEDDEEFKKVYSEAAQEVAAES